MSLIKEEIKTEDELIDATVDPELQGSCSQVKFEYVEVKEEADSLNWKACHSGSREPTSEGGHALIYDENSITKRNSLDDYTQSENHDSFSEKRPYATPCSGEHSQKRTRTCRASSPYVALQRLEDYPTGSKDDDPTGRKDDDPTGNKDDDPTGRKDDDPTGRKDYDLGDSNKECLSEGDLGIEDEDCEIDQEMEEELSENTNVSDISEDHTSSSGSEDDNSSSDEGSSSEEEVEELFSRQWNRENIGDSRHLAYPRFPFTGSSKINFDYSAEGGALQYFNLYFDDALVNKITFETNLFAEQTIAALQNDAARARATRLWRATTSDEIRVFLLMILAQSLVTKPEARFYWKSDPIIHTDFFGKTMSRDRFMKIKQYLHFDDNTKYDEATHPCPKLRKIWPIYKSLSEKFSKVYMPERDVTIDESLLLYKGRLSWVQYIPLKRARFGIKSYLLCESTSGYVWSFIIYTGKGTVFHENYKDLNISLQVVMTLMKPLLNLGYCLTTDNFYTSPQLADLLIKNKTDTYGTLRLNRKEVPEGLRNAKLKKGDVSAYRRGKVLVMKWKDKKDVSLLSTIHGTKMVDKEKRGVVTRKPALVADYNDTMGGVDKVDQHLADYSVPRKCTKKYYKKIFFHLLDLAIWNAYLLFTKTGGTLTPLQYRLKLIHEMMQKYFTTPPPPKGLPPMGPMPHRLTGKHFPMYIPASEKKSNHSKQCVLCCKLKDARGKKLRKETRFQCDACEVALCVVGCFKVYHTELNLP